MTTALPISAVPLHRARGAILAAVLEQPRPTVRSVASAAGVGLTEAYRHLTRLRDLGLVAWEPGQAGTLRPLVTLEPIGGKR